LRDRAPGRTTFGAPNHLEEAGFDDADRFVDDSPPTNFTGS